ncbi:hypothetical protein [Paracoccus aminovorans]|uniref:hypothetical protein n=1 Tax=Paracoccus aminovorans TaxID=34004 RepID=UPI002B25B7F1|nr:hypothetical protein [Paracoccus aminovorans]
MTTLAALTAALVLARLPALAAALILIAALTALTLARFLVLVLLVHRLLLSCTSFDAARNRVEVELFQPRETFRRHRPPDSRRHVPGR